MVSSTQTFDLQPLDEVFEKYKTKKGALIPILQDAQDIYGFLPEVVLEKIAENQKMKRSEVLGVVTFYSQFHLKPRGRQIIRCCQGTACHVKGGKKIIEKFEEILNIKVGETTEDLEFTLETVACVGACSLAPVVMINEDTYGRLTPDKIAKIIKERGNK